MKRHNQIKNTRKGYNKSNRGLTFSPTTRVRDQYESVDPLTGQLQINRNNYKVDATDDDKMPGYTMHNSRFRPHSKSALQISISEMKRLQSEKINDEALGIKGNNLTLANLNTGWQPALSSYDPKWKATNVPAAYANRNAMIAYFGNKWVEAESIREQAEKEKTRLIAQAKDLYIQRMKALAKGFLQKTGVKAPYTLDKEVELFLYKLSRTPGISSSEYNRKKDAFINKLQTDLDKVPFEIRDNLDKQIMITKANLESQLATAESVGNAIYAKAVKGMPIASRVKRTLSNRLRNAQTKAALAATEEELIAADAKYM